MLHVSTSAAHVIMHSQTARSVQCTDGTVTHGLGGGGVSTLQTGVQNGNRSRYIIPVNYKNKLPASCAKKVIKIHNFSLPLQRAVRVVVSLAGIAVSATNAWMLREVSGY
jgi:hypothetical protein